MSDSKEFIRNRNIQFENLYKDNKIADLADLYAVDAKMLSPGQPIIVGREAVKKHYSGEDRELADRFLIFSEETLKFGSEAMLDRGKYRVLKGEQVVDEGKYVTVYKKVDGKWFTNIEAYNSDRY